MWWRLNNCAMIRCTIKGGEEKFMVDKTSPEKAVKELTMLLMCLTRFNERGRFASDLDIAWKGYNFDIINKLDEENYIRQGNRRSKPIAITDEGMKLSRELLAKYNIDDE